MLVAGNCCVNLKTAARPKLALERALEVIKFKFKRPSRRKVECLVANLDSEIKF